MYLRKPELWENSILHNFTSKNVIYIYYILFIYIYIYLDAIEI